jgi:hypothetical protein
MTSLQLIVHIAAVELDVRSNERQSIAAFVLAPGTSRDVPLRPTGEAENDNSAANTASMDGRARGR